MIVNLQLDNRTAVVTGASSGIGESIARRVGLAGAHVFLLGRTVDPLDALREEIRREGGHAEILAADIRDSETLVEGLRHAAGKTGRLDILVNSAGTSFPGSILDGSLPQWREMIEVNQLAPLVAMQEAVRLMRQFANGGHIISISSIAALRPDSGVYGATKIALNYLMEGLRQELEDDDIRVTSVMPGVVATNFARHLDPEIVAGIAAVAGVDFEWTPGTRIPAEALEGAQTALPGLIAKPDDVAELVAYILSLPLRLNIPSVVLRPAKQLLT